MESRRRTTLDIHNPRTTAYNFSYLPYECLCRIFRELSAKDLTHFFGTSKALRRLADNLEGGKLWKYIAEERFPEETLIVEPRQNPSNAQAPYTTFKALVCDNNRRNASAILDLGPLQPSEWQRFPLQRSDPDDLYYSNQILGADLMWGSLDSRPREFFVIQVEARGQSDLRGPACSKIVFVVHYNGKNLIWDYREAFQVAPRTSDGYRLAALIFESPSVLLYSEETKLLDAPGVECSLAFFYSLYHPKVQLGTSFDSLKFKADYQPITLIRQTRDIRAAWKEAQMNQQYRAHFEKLRQVSRETVETSRQRWLHVPEHKLYSQWFDQPGIDPNIVTAE